MSNSIPTYLTYPTYCIVSSKLLVEDFPTLDLQGGNCQKDRPTVQYSTVHCRLRHAGWMEGMEGWDVLVRSDGIDYEQENRGVNI